MVKGQAWWCRSILPAIFLAWPRSLMSPESHGDLTEITSFAIHAFMFLWPDIFSWFPIQIVLWTSYRYEAIVTRHTRLVIRVIKRSNHCAYLGGHYFIISFWLTPLHVLLIRSIQQRHRMDLITTLVDYVLEFSSAFFRCPRSNSTPAKNSWFLAAEPVWRLATCPLSHPLSYY